MRATESLATPVYPTDAKARGVEGYVELEILVGVDGLVKDVRLVSATPAGVFEASAIEAARQWRFEPSRDDDGRPLVGWVRVPVHFTL